MSVRSEIIFSVATISAIVNNKTNYVIIINKKKIVSYVETNSKQCSVSVKRVLA